MNLSAHKVKICLKFFSLKVLCPIFFIPIYFSFSALLRWLSEKVTKGCLETTEVLLDADLPKFEIYQGTVSPNCFKSPKNSWCPDFCSKKRLCLMSGLKFTLSNVTSFPTDKFFSLIKKYIWVCFVVSIRSNLMHIFEGKSMKWWS